MIEIIDSWNFVPVHNYSQKYKDVQQTSHSSVHARIGSDCMIFKMNPIPIGPIICTTCTVVEKLIEQYQEMKLNDEICRSTLTNLKSLLDLLKAVERLDYHQPPQEVRSAINKIAETFANYEKKCFKQTAKDGDTKYVFAFPKKQEMLTMQSEVLQCTTTLNTALAVAAKAERDKEGRRQSQEERIKHGFDRVPSGTFEKYPSLQYLQMMSPVYRKDGSVELSWYNENISGSVENYELEIKHDNEKYSVQLNDKKYVAKPFVFHPLQSYRVRVRCKGAHGVNQTSPWSESMIVRVTRAPPNKPSNLLRVVEFFCSRSDSNAGDVDSVTLVIPYPLEEDCNGAPLTKIVVHYYDENATTVQNLTLLVNPSPGENNSKTVNIKGLDLRLTYTFSTSWVNECGESEHSDILTVNKQDTIPGPPRNVRESTKKTDNLLKLRWNPPAINAFAVDHYDVHMMDKDGVFTSASPEGKKICKCSATIRNLSQNKKYIFRVCSVNNKGVRSSFTEEIMVETNLSNAVKGAIGGAGVAGGIAGGVLFGAVSGPVGGVAVGVLAGISAAEKVENKAGKAVVGTLAGVGAGVASGIGLTLLTPLNMICSPVMFALEAGKATAKSMEKNWSDQSSDEEEEGDKSSDSKSNKSDNDNIRKI